MNVREIVKDSVNYPLSNWKKILILGIILVINGLSGIFISFNATNADIIWLLAGIGFIIGFLASGYLFRIIRSSLVGNVELPEFDDLIDMGTDGVKVFIVGIVYLIPAIIITSVLTALFNSYAELTFGSLLNLSQFLFSPLMSVIWQGIMVLTVLLYELSIYVPEGIWGLIGILYVIAVIPILMVAMANMAYYEGDFKSAFKYSEILNKIRSIGWFNLIKWYIEIGILFLAIFIIASIIAYFLSLVYPILGGALISLILLPYLYIYTARSVALLYMPE